MSSAWAACTGSWRPRCSRPSRASTARRSRRWPQAQGRHRHPRRAAQVPATGHRARQGQEATGRPLRRDTPAASAHSRPHRPAARHGQRQAERADTPAPRRALRTLRGHGGPRGPPRPQARRPQQARTAGETPLDGTHGQATAQDPRYLPPLPRGHPRWKGNHALPEMITGEQGARKPASPVREETDGKGPWPRAPRRRSTSL